MATEAPVSVLTPIWLCTLPVLIVVLIWLRGRVPSAQKSRETPSASAPPPPGSPSWWWPAVSVVAAVGAATAAVAGAPWPVVWTLAFCSLACCVAGIRRRLSRAPDFAQTSPGQAFAAVCGLAIAALSLFLNRPSTDDVFYVGRATATAQLNHIPVRDVIFTHEQVDRSGGTGLPTDSFSALQGALGQLFHVHPASMAYYVVPPVFSFLAVWALWRLLRLWAPRHVAFCLALGLVYWLWSAQTVNPAGFPYAGSLTPGHFFITRIWQGKAVLVCWLVPTMYMYLTRWLRGRDRLTAVLIVGTCVAGIGLSSSAAFVIPLVFLAAAPAYALFRAWARLALLVAAAGVPFAIGFVAAHEFPLPAFETTQPPAEWYYSAVLGVGLVGVVATIAVLVAPWLARRGEAAAVTAGIVAVIVLLLAPGFLSAVDNVFGLYAPGALRRTLWVAPLPALVGLLAAAPWTELIALPRRRLARFHAWGERWPAAALLAGGIAVLLVFFGSPLWRSGDGTSYWRARPEWKVDRQYLVAAQAFLARYHGDGTILADKRIMSLIPILTVEPKAVNARTLYLMRTPQTQSRLEERLLLTRLAMNARPLPREQAIRNAAADLDVGLLCIQRSRVAQRKRVEETGTFRPSFAVRGYLCFGKR